MFEVEAPELGPSTSRVSHGSTVLPDILALHTFPKASRRAASRCQIQEPESYIHINDNEVVTSCAFPRDNLPGGGTQFERGLQTIGCVGGVGREVQVLEIYCGFRRLELPTTATSIGLGIDLSAITERGFSLTFESPKNEKVALFHLGERAYDHVLILPSKSKGNYAF